MTASANLPGFHVIAAALRATTETLAGEVVNPRDTAPDWNEFEWAIARAVCVMQGISGLLATRLRWRGPARFHEFLEAQHAELLGRDAQVAELLALIDKSFSEAGIACIPLKGSALRALKLHAPGVRPQGDIDLLLDPRDLSASGPLLAALGFEPRYSTRRHDVYARPRQVEAEYFSRHADNPLKIELHTQVAETLPIEQVDITASIRPAHTSPGANPYASPAALLRHLSLHMAGSMRANAMRFIQVYDVAQLARRMTATCWRELLDEGAGRRRCWWLFPPLSMAARYVPGSVPAHVLADLRSVCPRRLRNRFDQVSVYEVSWSNLRIPALPGREWSRTLGDTLRLAGNRLWPTRLALDELAAQLVVQPQLMQLRWYGASHAERIVRWLFTHPPRVQTMMSVRLALGQSPGS